MGSFSVILVLVMWTQTTMTLAEPTTSTFNQSLPTKQPDYKEYTVDKQTAEYEISNNGVSNSGTCNVENRLEPGFKRGGDAYRLIATPTAEDCANLCLTALKGCVAINYEHETKTCFLLDKPGYILSVAGYTTALANPCNDFVCNSDNYIINHHRGGSDMPGTPVQVSTATDCCVLCYGTPGCIAFDYGTDNSKCYLKNTVPAISYLDDCVTGVVCVNC